MRGFLVAFAATIRPSLSDWKGARFEHSAQQGGSGRFPCAAQASGFAPAGAGLLFRPSLRDLANRGYVFSTIRPSLSDWKGERFEDLATKSDASTPWHFCGLAARLKSIESRIYPSWEKLQTRGRSKSQGDDRMVETDKR